MEGTYTSEKSAELPVDPKTITTTTTAAIASPRKSRRAVQKRVVSVPIADLDGFRIKGEGAPPSDSWAWRKYGQKPIKGSPYPRGYYRCSSSKGCPARKQVERSRVDPTMLVVTYACEHNHPWPTSRNQSHHQQPQQQQEATSPTFSAAATTATGTSASPTNQAEIEPEDKFADLMITTDEFSWFSDMVSSSSATIIESPFCAESTSGGDAADVAMLFPMREEDELLYADLGELPECSLVFRQSEAVFEQDEERRRCSLRAAPLCGSSG